MNRTDIRYWLACRVFYVWPGIGRRRHEELCAAEVAAFHRGRTPAESNRLAREAEERTDAFCQYLGNIERLGLSVASDDNMPVLWART